MLNLTGRRCVITGAARGLGRSFAIRFAELGADIVLTGRSKAALEQTASVIREKTTVCVQCVVMDLADPDSTNTAVNEIAGSPVDLLINNGAGWLEGSLEQNSVAEITNTVGSTVTGMAIVLRGLMPVLRRSKAPDIVTIVSTCGLAHVPVQTASPVFHAAKRGQAALVEAISGQLTMGGIRSIAIFPPDFDGWDPLDGRDAELDHPIDAADVVDSVEFALSRRRQVVVRDIVLGRMDCMGNYV
ncbi:MAG: SDR family NAD(P)-dependent oxidoreductase [Alphaproteobacteria bacterium]|nr:SDR family NAD(P)-dependent oxidoreductase [Alphaproteobacteria bacterium]